MKTKKDEDDQFYPRGGLDGRSNYKRRILIHRDGSVTEQVRLHVLEKRLREEIICLHFMQFLARHVLQQTIGYNIVSRDAPWDFELELSDGQAFNVEIVSIADSEHQYIVNAREENRDLATYDSTITLRQLRKIAYAFPDANLAEVIATHEADGHGPDDRVENPNFGIQNVIYLSSNPDPDGTLEDRIDRAISAKESKSDARKGETYLLIDNRTWVSHASEVHGAAEKLQERLRASPFREIWFYTGYCSDSDGRNGEYTMIPLKMSKGTQKRLCPLPE